MRENKVLYRENSFSSFFIWICLITGIVWTIVGFTSNVYLFIAGVFIIFFAFPLILILKRFYSIVLKVESLKVGKDNIKTNDIISVISDDEIIPNQDGKLLGGAYDSFFGQSKLTINLKDGTKATFGAFRREKLVDILTGQMKK